MPETEAALDTYNHFINELVLTVIKAETTRHTESDYYRASDFFQDWWAEVTHGAKNGRSFSEMMGPNISN